MVQNLGSYRTTSHPYRIIFQIGTEVHVTGNFLNPMDSLSLISSVELRHHQHDHDFLVDTIGLLTAVSDAKEYNTEAKIVKLLFLELTDVSGVLRCALSGDYVDEFKSLLGHKIKERNIIVLRFVKIKMFLGFPTLENVNDITKIFVNPDVKVTHEFKERLTFHGISTDLPISKTGPKNRIFREADFLLFYPKKTIYDLNSMIEEGFFVVSATLNGCIKDENWWYSSSTCRKIKHDNSNLVSSRSTPDHIFQLTPKYKVKFNVFDGTDQAVFVLFDSDLKSLLEKNCGNKLWDLSIRVSVFARDEIAFHGGKRVCFKSYSRWIL